VDLIRWLPGGYYLATRYSTPMDRLGYLVKYWLPFPLILSTTVPGIPWWHWSQFLALAAFLSVYDVFCLRNDAWSADAEQRPLRRTDGTTLPRTAHLRRRIAVAIPTVVASVSATSLSGGRLLPSVAFLAALAIVFALHNVLPERARIATFFALYLLKGGVFLFGWCPTPPPREIAAYLVFTVLYAAIYLPTYTLRKLDLLSGRPRLRRWLSFVLPSKIALLAGLVLWDPRLWTVPAVVLGGTVAQWVARRLGKIATGAP
jgi:hypothetical protein